MNQKRNNDELLTTVFGSKEVLEPAPTDVIPQGMMRPEIAYQIGKMKCFRNYADKLVNPLFIWYMNPDYDKKAKWTLYDLQALLQQSGWMVPAYTMPENLENLVVMRVVVRQGTSRDMIDMLIDDIKNAVAELEKLEYPTDSRIKYEKQIKQKGRVFTH